MYPRLFGHMREDMKGLQRHVVSKHTDVAGHVIPENSRSPSVELSSSNKESCSTCSAACLKSTSEGETKASV